MKSAPNKAASILIMAALVSGCASSPNNIRAAHVSPIKYQDFTCDQIGVERASLERGTSALHRSLKHRRDGDTAKMAIGVVLFWPALLFLKGNGSKKAEFARLKGDYEALRVTSASKNCSVEFRPSLEKVASTTA